MMLVGHVRGSTLLRRLVSEAQRGGFGVVAQGHATWRRHMSTTATLAADSETETSPLANAVVEYEGSFSGPLKRLKMVSVASCSCALVSMPMLLLAGNEGMEFAQRAVVSGTVLSFALGTTAALHFFTRGYVHRIISDPDGTLQIETLNLFARVKTATVENGIEDLGAATDSAMASFKVKSSGAHFFAHGDDSHEFKSKTFYERFIAQIS